LSPEGEALSKFSYLASAFVLLAGMWVVVLLSRAWALAGFIAIGLVAGGALTLRSYRRYQALRLESSRADER
jgi:hypothetical protein